MNETAPPAALVWVVMGVAGTGKSTLGAALSEALRWPFIEGDDHHPAVNSAKMASGTPLADADREPWIDALAQAALAAPPPCLIACSALTKSVRERLAKQLVSTPRYLALTAPRAILAERLANRADHFFPPALLDSQLDAFDPPLGARTLDASTPLVELVADALAIIRAETLTKALAPSPTPPKTVPPQER